MEFNDPYKAQSIRLGYRLRREKLKEEIMSDQVEANMKRAPQLVNRHKRRAQQAGASKMDTVKKAQQMNHEASDLVSQALKALQLANLAVVETVRDKLQFEGVDLNSAEVVVVRALTDTLPEEAFAGMIDVIQKALNKKVLVIPKDAGLAAMDTPKLNALGWFQTYQAPFYPKVRSVKDNEEYDLMDSNINIAQEDEDKTVNGVILRSKDGKRFAISTTEFREMFLR